MDVKLKESRHVCLICKSKKTASKMVKHRSHWTCLACLSVPGNPAELRENIELRAGNVSGAYPAAGSTRYINILNLYAGLGGNRKNWTGVKVTAVERDVKIAAAYKQLYPEDTIIIGDAHQYLLKNYYRFDAIWSSPPCQHNSRMNYIIKEHKKRYPDLSLYQEVLFLREFFQGKPWVVENVDPYYTPLVEPTKKVDRHLFWSNCEISTCTAPPLEQITKGLKGIAALHSIEDKKLIMDWLGIYYHKNLYSSGKNYIQVFRNCVHPVIGQSIFNDMVKFMQAAGSTPG